MYTYCIVGNFQGDNLHEFHNFIATHESFLHKILGTCHTHYLHVYGQFSIPRSFLHKVLPSYQSFLLLLVFTCNYCMCALFPIAVLIVFCGLFINGPYALITTAVSNDLVRNCTHAHICTTSKIWHKNNNCAALLSFCP